MAQKKIFNILSIAGIDPSGGAGVFADIKVISALGAYGCSIVTNLTIQNTQGVKDIFPIPLKFIDEQFEILFSDICIDSIKIGMLHNSNIIHLIAKKITKWKMKNIVLDPVIAAKSGDKLLEDSAIDNIRDILFPLVTLVTPNIPEAGILLGIRPSENIRDMRHTAEKLHHKMSKIDNNKWVMIKGGHLPGNYAIDVLYDGNHMVEIPETRIKTSKTHGTGCSLSAAIATLLPKTDSVLQATYLAKKYITKCIKFSEMLEVGSGKGPIHHFHNWW
ncbi:MAG: bifunctional hydroxymethylpyrimidine kinase/phosphomethylpyrimidine kinase [Bordetella sp.]|nr:MAG: bifunctional hydroxymethylpyrimidine kinase/phosphomethylpyrimidine kinase [Bordetella sp.]